MLPNTALFNAPAMSLRVAGVEVRGTIADDSDDTTNSDQWGPVLWGTLDLCAAAEMQQRQRHHRQSGKATSGSSSSKRKNDTQKAALMLLDIDYYSNTPILSPLTTRYADLISALEVLRITSNTYDESADLGAFAAVATHLTELTFRCCGLTSVQGLEGHCTHLKKLDLNGCEHLSSLAGVENHLLLEDIDASSTAIPSIRELVSCPALTVVEVSGCEALRSLSGLENHKFLEMIDASSTPISSLGELLTCPALSVVELSGCEQLTSLAGLEHHALLEVVGASNTAITSVRELQTCPALTVVELVGCEDLADADVTFPEGVDVKWVDEDDEEEDDQDDEEDDEGDFEEDEDEDAS